MIIFINYFIIIFVVSKFLVSAASTYRIPDTVTDDKKAEVSSWLCANKQAECQELFQGDSFYFGFHKLMTYGYFASVKLYCNPIHQIDFNVYLVKRFWDFAPGPCFILGHQVDISRVTPLIYAVGRESTEIVKAIVEADLSPKLNLSQSYKWIGASTARSIARKIYNKDRREAMLQLLQINRDRHCLKGVSFSLKGDLDMTVREAVFANDYEMVEACCLLGNFGDKTDTNIMKRAVINNNSYIIEILKEEGYAVPTDWAKYAEPNYKEFLSARYFSNCTPNIGHYVKFES